MFHTHKWDVPVNRYQTCKKCGLVKKVECAHFWVEDSRWESHYIHGDVDCLRLTLKCSMCGDIKTEDA